MASRPTPCRAGWCGVRGRPSSDGAGSAGPRTATVGYPEYSARERFADNVIHIAGVGAALAGVAVLLLLVIPGGEVSRIVAAVVYGAALVATLGLSAAYNMACGARRKAVLRRFDHAVIFIMIAATYTPFALVALDAALGGTLLLIVWSAGLAGFGLKLFHPGRFERIFVVLYLALGWAGLPMIGPLTEALSVPVLVLLGLGGVFYTAGVAFHLWNSLPYQNAVWHGFVLVAAGCHYAAVLLVLM